MGWQTSMTSLGFTTKLELYGPADIRGKEGVGADDSINQIWITIAYCICNIHRVKVSWAKQKKGKLQLSKSH